MYLRHQFGQKAENEAASWFLSHKESRLLVRNYRCKAGEIDLIFEELLSAVRAPELVFVEVRARSQEGWLNGAESVDLRKQQRLKRTADHFLSRYRGPAKSLRFDLLYWDKKVWVHMENVWLIA